MPSFEYKESTRELARHQRQVGKTGIGGLTLEPPEGYLLFVTRVTVITANDTVTWKPADTTKGFNELTDNVTEVVVGENILFPSICGRSVTFGSNCSSFMGYVCPVH